MGYDPESIRQMVDRLPHSAARKLFQEVAAPGSSGERICTVRKVLLEKLNQSRREHDRRLFTALFEPLLCRDGRFLDPQFTPPGYLHLIDVGGFWHVLSRDHFPALAQTVQERLELLAADMPVDQALASEQGRSMAEQLRKAAIAAIAQVLGAQDTCKDLLIRVNIWRQDNAKRARISTTLRPLLREDLLLVRAILAMPLDLADMIRDLVGRADRLDSLNHVMTECALAVDGDQRLAPLAALIPLMLMHEYRDYRTSVYVLRNAPAPVAVPVLDALERHLKLTCREFAKVLSEAVGIGGVMSGPLLVSKASRNRLNIELDYLRQLIGIHTDFDLGQNQRIGTASREHLNLMLCMVEKQIFPVLLDRTIIASRSSLRPSSDHEEVLWLLGIIWNWRDLVREQIQWGSQFTIWRDNLLGFLQESFKTAVASRDYEDIRQHWEHILRIDALAARFGWDMTKWLTPLDHAMVRVTVELLEDPSEVPSRAAILISVVKEYAEAELARIKYWKDPTLLRLTELYRARIGT